VSNSPAITSPRRGVRLPEEPRLPAAARHPLHHLGQG
jgi:hypothetical protein